MTCVRFDGLRKRFERMGYALRPLWSGYGVYKRGDLLTFRPNLDSVEALLLTRKEVERGAKRLAKGFDATEG